MVKFIKRALMIVGAFVVFIMLIPDSCLGDEDYSGENYDFEDSTESTYNSGMSYAELVDSQRGNSQTIEGLRMKRDYSGADSVTVMMYFNGSDLESEYSEATSDISEILSADYNDDVNIVIQTVGTKKWDSKYGIASDHSQRYRIGEAGLELVDDSLGQLNGVDGSTLRDFIQWSKDNYPAERYILQMWDHGGGPVYGFGYDQNQSDEESMSVDEIQEAITSAGVFFDFIGMDCCIMANLETCCAMYECCDYMILSEDFESGLGWSYKGWISALANNPNLPTSALAKIAIDDFVASNENEEGGDTGILALIDESVMPVLYKAWTDYAYANESDLLGQNYSKKVARKAGGRILPAMDKKNKKGFLDWLLSDDANMADYYVTDIMALASNVDSKEGEALKSALYNSIVYCNTTSNCNSLTGLSVTLPYGDDDFYTELKKVFGHCGIDENYISWLQKFTSASGANNYYSYSDWEEEWDGWEEYDDEYDWLDWLWEDDDYDYEWSEDDSCDDYDYDWFEEWLYEE